MDLGEDIKVLPYISNMAEVMTASDLVVCRSGAITLSEIAALKKHSGSDTRSVTYGKMLNI